MRRTTAPKRLKPPRSFLVRLLCVLSFYQKEENGIIIAEDMEKSMVSLQFFQTNFEWTIQYTYVLLKKYFSKFSNGQRTICRPCSEDRKKQTFYFLLISPRRQLRFLLSNFHFAVARLVAKNDATVPKFSYENSNSRELIWVTAKNEMNEM